MIYSKKMLAVRRKFIFLITVFSVILLSGWGCRVTDDVVDLTKAGNSTLLQKRNDSSGEDAYKAIHHLFNQYQVIGISELHLNQQIWDFLETLVRQPWFPAKASNIGFEGGNSLYQELMDRYTFGENVSDEEIKKVWRDNSQVNKTFDAPVYFRFIKTVREINQKLNPKKKLRILLLDVPIDWEKIKGREDYLPYLFQRDQSIADVIENEVYKKGGKVLLIGGAKHVDISQKGSPKSGLSLIEAKHVGTTFSVGFYNGFALNTSEALEIEQQLDTWPKPGYIDLKNSWFGSLNAGINLKGDYPGLKMHQIHDGIIYLGKRTELTVSDPSVSICTGKPEDELWINTMLERQTRIGRPPFLKDTREKICTPLPRLYLDYLRY